MTLQFQIQNALNGDSIGGAQVFFQPDGSGEVVQGISDDNGIVTFPGILINQEGTLSVFQDGFVTIQDWVVSIGSAQSDVATVISMSPSLGVNSHCSIQI